MRIPVFWEFQYFENSSILRIPVFYGVLEDFLFLLIHLKTIKVEDWQTDNSLSVAFSNWPTVVDRQLRQGQHAWTSIGNNYKNRFKLFLTQWIKTNTPSPPPPPNISSWLNIYLHFMYRFLELDVAPWYSIWSWCAMGRWIDPSWWNHWAISHSSQYSTAGVPNTVVCALLSVEWWI